MSPSHNAVSAADPVNTATIETLIRVLDRLMQTVPDITLEELRLFLEVAHFEGEAQYYYMQRLNLPKSSTGRYFAILSDKGFRNKAALQLLSSAPSPNHWKEVFYHPSAKGRALLSDLRRHLCKFCDKLKVASA